MTYTIPEGSTIQRLKNGNVLITYPGALIPALCVEPNQYVRTAIIRRSVTQLQADAARQYVAQHLFQQN